MSVYTNPFYKIYHWLASIPPKITWGNKRNISIQDKDQIASILASGYYIILVGNRTHLSSVIVSFLSWIKTGKWAKYSHVLMNCDNIENPEERHKFKFVEADVKGVVYTTFDQVFACDYVCLLTPKHMSNLEWTKVIDALIHEVGKPYDDLFNLTDDTALSCVEVVLDALKTSDYQENFSELDKMIKDTGNLVPQMYRECIDFTVLMEIPK